MTLNYCRNGLAYVLCCLQSSRLHTPNEDIRQLEDSIGICSGKVSVEVDHARTGLKSIPLVLKGRRRNIAGAQAMIIIVDGVDACEKGSD
jgi:hypothetical protein